ncbi:polymorphic toxin-type HINT domain-containing protein [Plantactinospora sp. KBS50]|uniref:polymorphic toxin-type HINT domain-containing protein n=1 Tax=Plantactinospora sp. KBS50 TaxID=2024580 RepID=UPI000BAAA9B9|nr:polymorphic toxin-type HINT domain-containing protein [Plantactinospora sp. KBS50]ASW54036.1 hypothetical protein CIK06_07315 [Plantactinospora sp. KBS50]
MAVAVSAALPAAVVSVARDVVDDVAKATTQLYQQAVEAGNSAIEGLSRAAQVVAETSKAALPAVAGIAAGVLTTGGCLLATGGAGSAACVVAGFAVGGAVTSALSCPPGRSIAGCAVTGAIAGTVAGVVTVATGGLGGGLAATMIGGGLSSAASDATEQLLTTGHVDAGELLEQGIVGAGTAGILRGAGKVAKPRCNSFVPSTQVLMADGSHKAIEDVKIGDRVVAADPTTGKTSSQPVTDVITGSGQKNLVAVTVAVMDRDGPDDGARVQPAMTGTVTTTANHPFFVDDHGRPADPFDGSGHWANAGALVAGEHIATNGGDDARVVATRDRIEYATVHNLTVDGVHTYYVIAGNTPVLVHNCGDAAKHSVDNLADSLGDDVFFHYTDEAGHATIMEGGVVKANSKGVSYFAQDMVKSGDANNVLFAGNPRYAGRGSHVIGFRISPDRLGSGVQPNELVHQGSFRFTPDDVIYHGPNPFG